MTECSAADTDRIFEELKAEHRRGLEAGDMEGLQRVQEKLAELGRDGIAEVVVNQQLEATNRGLSWLLFVAAAGVVVVGIIGYMAS